MSATNALATPDMNSDRWSSNNVESSDERMDTETSLLLDAGVTRNESRMDVLPGMAARTVKVTFRAAPGDSCPLCLRRKQLFLNWHKRLPCLSKRVAPENPGFSSPFCSAGSACIGAQ